MEKIEEVLSQLSRLYEFNRKLQTFKFSKSKKNKDRKRKGIRLKTLFNTPLRGA